MKKIPPERGQSHAEWLRSRTSLFRTMGIIVLAFTVVLVTTAVGTVGWIGAERGLNPSLHEPDWTLSDFPNLQPEEISFDSPSGFTVTGRFFPGTHEAGVILLHGFGASQDHVLPQAQMLNEAGYNVLTYDARHPRYGDGIFATFGLLERHDLIAAVDYLASRSEVNPERIGVYGISLGAATVILGADLDDRIKVVVSESTFSDGDSVIATSFERFIGLPAFPFAPVARMIAEWRAGVKLKDAQPIDAIPRIDPRPILLIHGLEDDAVPPEHSERLLAAAGENANAWWVPSAGHTDAHQVAPDEYRERLLEFFDRTLRD